MFSVPSVGAFARTMLRALIDPKPLAVSPWKHISSLLHLTASDYRRDWLWCGDELWWIFFGPRDLVLDGQSVSGDTDQSSTDLANMKKEANTQTEKGKEKQKRKKHEEKKNDENQEK